MISIGSSANPRSFGLLRINNDDPYISPQIPFSFLNRHDELMDAKKCLRVALGILRNFTSEFGARILDPINEGMITDDFIQNNVMWPGHFVGVARVGPVLRSDLCVLRVVKRHIVDASWIESIPISSGSIAEFGSDHLVRSEKKRAVRKRAFHLLREKRIYVKQKLIGTHSGGTDCECE